VREKVTVTVRHNCFRQGSFAPFRGLLPPLLLSHGLRRGLPYSARSAGSAPPKPCRCLRAGGTTTKNVETPGRGFNRADAVQKTISLQFLRASPQPGLNLDEACSADHLAVNWPR
jgi:hypothetical protein